MALWHGWRQAEGAKGGPQGWASPSWASESGCGQPGNVSPIRWQLSLIPAPGRGRLRGQLGVCHVPSGISVPDTCWPPQPWPCRPSPSRARRTEGEGQRESPGVWESRVCLSYSAPTGSLPHIHTLMNGVPECMPLESSCTHHACTLQGPTTSCPKPPGSGPHHESLICTSHSLFP